MFFAVKLRSCIGSGVLPARVKLPIFPVDNTELFALVTAIPNVGAFVGSSPKCRSTVEPAWVQVMLSGDVKAAYRVPDLDIFTQKGNTCVGIGMLVTGPPATSRNSKTKLAPLSTDAT